MEQERPDRKARPSGARQAFGCEGKNLVDLIPRNTGKPFEEFVHRGSGFKVIEESGNRHAGTTKHPSSADLVGVSFNYAALFPIHIKYSAQKWFKIKAGLLPETSSVPDRSSP